MRRPAGDRRRDLRGVARTRLGATPHRAGTVGPTIRKRTGRMNPDICKADRMARAVDSRQFASAAGARPLVASIGASIPMKPGSSTGCAITTFQTVQTNRPNSSGLTAHQCPWLRPGRRPNNGCGRKAVDSESQSIACRGARFPASGAFGFRAPAMPRRPRDAIRCSAQNRLHIYSYELRAVRPRAAHPGITPTGRTRCK